jgi:cysteinyl-tRNA synthetase
MIRLYNSLSKKKETLKTIEPQKVRMYNCGPTVYDYAHIGNLRSFIGADIFRRVFEFNDYSVEQVINITDVGHLTDDGDNGEDKIEKKAKLNKKSATDITNYYTEAFMKDIESLNIKTENTMFPKATDHIKEQIEIIKKLEEKNFIYKTSDGVYFNTSKIPECDFFKVVGDNLKEGARVEINSEKHSPTDFALWKFSNPQENRQQEWDSLWGVGFPGWHLECSAMAIKYLGEQLDVHSGGIDHKFPHHPNEIIQSENATGKKPFSRYWLHNEFLSVDGSKMSKSKGNFITLNNIMERGHSPKAFRFWLLGTHYRTPANFTWEAIRGASNAYEKMIEKIQSLYPENPGAVPDQKYLETFKEYLNNDFDTPSGLALLWKLLKDRQVKKETKLATVREFDKVLGLDLLTQSNKKTDIPAEVTELIMEREEAREQKNWKKSDLLRDKIKSLGFLIKDTPEGTQIKRKK